MRPRLALTGAVAGLIALVAAGCVSGTKSGGTSTHVIRIVMQTPDAPDADAEYFIAQVQKQSGGRIQILEGTDYSSNDPNNEARLGQALQSGKVEMAYLPSRAWERVSSVTDFRALQAPLLVTNYPLLQRITTGPIGRSMLSSLGSIGVVGLGLVPDELRRPLGRRPLASPQAFRGARIRVVTSPTSVLALRSLGAVPLTNYTSHSLGPALQSGQLDGAELSTIAITNNGYVPQDARDLTANLALFAKTQTIAIRKSVFDRLSAGDRNILQAAASATVAHADPAKQEKTELVQLCREGLRIVRATKADIALLGREAAAAYPALERDPVTRREMGAIERLKARLGAAPSALPACPQQTSPAGTSATTLSGTYVVTASHAEIAGFPGSSPNDNWGSFRLVFRGNRFRLSDSRPGGASVVGPPEGFTAGTYTLQGDRITFTQRSAAGDTPLGVSGNDPIVFTWSLYRGALTFRRLSTKAQLAATGKGLDPYGPPFLYVKPWQKSSSSSPAPRRHASGFPTGVFETKIMPADVRRVAGPTWWAHWEMITYRKNGTFTDVWFHPRRADQPTVNARYFVHGDLLRNSAGDVFRWSYYRGLLMLRIVKNVDQDALGYLIIQTHPWRKIS